MKASILPFLLIGLSIAMSVAGQITMKLGINQSSPGGFADSSPIEVLLTAVRSPLVLLGLVFYGLGAAAWIVVLSRLDLSYAYPFIALNFVLIALVSRLVLAESIPAVRWAGIGMICIGIVLIARGQPGG